MMTDEEQEHEHDTKEHPHSYNTDSDDDTDDNHNNDNAEEEGPYTIIHDLRIVQDMKTSSFSGYKKTQALKQLGTELIKQDIVNACFWAFDLLCAGHFYDVIEQFISVFSKHIHVAQPSIGIYLSSRLSIFETIVDSGYRETILLLRNHKTIRSFVCEIICILCFAKHAHAIDIIKITKNDFNPQSIIDKTRATNEYYATHYFDDEYDPIILFPAVNEFVYHLVDTKSSIDACYWIEWIANFTAISNKHKNKLIAKTRLFPSVSILPKFQKEVIWIIWTILLFITKKRPAAHKLVLSLLSLYAFQYNGHSIYTKRRHLVYTAIQIGCAVQTTYCPTVLDSDKKPIVAHIVTRVDNVIQEIAQHQFTKLLIDDTDTTYHLRDTLQKLQIMQQTI